MGVLCVCGVGGGRVAGGGGLLSARTVTWLSAEELRMRPNWANQGPSIGDNRLWTCLSSCPDRLLSVLVMLCTMTRARRCSSGLYCALLVTIISSSGSRTGTACASAWKHKLQSPIAAHEVTIQPKTTQP